MISVFTLNLRFGLANDGPNNWVHREKVFPTLLEKYKSDFMGFQEANDFQTDFLDKILDEYDFIGKREPAPEFWQNNIIFYKKTWRCIHYEHFFLSVTPAVPSRSPKSRWPRQCTLGIFQNQHQQLICINTHFDFDASVQLESARMIMGRLSRLPSDIPAVLVGDFNAEPFCPSYLAFTAQDPSSLSSSAQTPYFKNVFHEPFPATYHGFTGKTNGKQIDWLLYRNHLTLKHAEVIQEPFDGIYPSDHYPVRAIFQWE